MRLYIHVAAIHRVNDTRIYLRQALRLNALGIRSLVLHNHPVDSLEEKPPSYSQSLYSFTRLPKARLFFSLKVILYVFRSNPYVIHFHEPDLLIWLPLMRLLFSSSVFVYDVHEDLQSQIYDSKKVPFFFKPLFSMFSYVLETIASRLCHIVVAATPRIAEKSQFKRCKHLCLLPNYPLQASCSTPPLLKRHRLTYIGGISSQRGIFSILDTLLLDRSLVLTLAGPIEDSIKQDLINHPAWIQVEYHGTVSYDIAMKLVGESYCSLLLFNRAANTIDSLPNKLFEYLSMGSPVVCSDFTGWRSVISSTNLGTLVNPLDTQAILKGVNYYRTQPNNHILASYRADYIYSNFTFDSYHDKLLDHIRLYAGDQKCYI